jgi:nucleoid-associated protein YgaU
MHAVTRELKIALLIGFCLVLVVSVLIADHLSAARNATLAEASGERMPLVHDPLAAVGEVTPGTGIIPGPLAMTPPATGVLEPITNGAPEQPIANQADAYAMVGAVPLREPAPPIAPPAPQSGSTPDAPFQPYTLVQGSGQSAPAAPANDLTLVQVAAREGVKLVDGTIELPAAMKTQLDHDSVHGTPVVFPPTSTETYTVKSGDNLYKIAKRVYGNGEKWRTLADANKDKISKNGNLQVGTVLLVPAAKVALNTVTDPTATVGARKTTDARAKTPGRTADPAPIAKSLAKSEPAAKKVTTYTVKPGDSLGQISKATLGTSKRVEDIIAANKGKLVDEDSIQVGMVLQIPTR